MYNFLDVYNKAFSCDSYNQHTDQEPRFKFAIDFINNNNICSVLDVGSGRGNLLKLIKHNNSNINITSADLNKFHSVDGVEFVKINLCDPSTLKIKGTFDLITCLDVLEHLTEDVIETVFKFFSDKAKYSVISIANHSDVHDGVELHLIQKDLNFWLPIIKKYFNVLSCTTEYNDRLYILTLENNKNEK